MKSWDALEEIADELKYVCNDGIKLAKYDERRILAIQKDLMILEILRKHCEVIELMDSDGNSINDFTFYLRMSENRKEFDEVMEWFNGR